MTELQIALLAWFLMGIVGSILGTIIDYTRYMKITLGDLVGALVVAPFGGPILLIMALVSFFSIYHTIVVFKRK